MQKIEQAERSAREERATSIIPAEIRESVELANTEPPVVDPPNMEKRGSKVQTILNDIDRMTASIEKIESPGKYVAEARYATEGDTPMSAR